MDAPNGGSWTFGLGNAVEVHQRLIGQIGVTNAILQQHEEQLERVRNVILAGMETTHLTEDRARGIFKDIADILNISLEQ